MLWHFHLHPRHLSEDKFDKITSQLQFTIFSQYILTKYKYEKEKENSNSLRNGQNKSSAYQMIYRMAYLQKCI